MNNFFITVELGVLRPCVGPFRSQDKRGGPHPYAGASFFWGAGEEEERRAIAQHLTGLGLAGATTAQATGPPPEVVALLRRAADQGE
jgi:hypothetical protein